MDKEYGALDIDQAAGVICPFYDEDTNVLFLAGKGDGNIRYYEIVNEDPFVFFVSEYKNNNPCKGVCMLPKRIVNTADCEVGAGGGVGDSLLIDGIYINRSFDY